MLAGIGGALYVPQVGIINPSEFAPANSIEAVIWVALGGRGTLWGAIIGAVGVNAAKSWLTGAFPEIWLYRPGRPVRRGDPVPAQGHRRDAARAAGQAAAGANRRSAPSPRREAAR